MDEETRHKKWDTSTYDGWLEIIAAILMSVAVVGSAYCAYQATRWSGVQATSFAEASTARIESLRSQTTGIQQTAYDASTTLQLIITYSEGETEIVSNLTDRFVRDEYRVYVDEWLALKPFENDDAPASPFELASYQNAKIVEAEALSDDASEKFEVALAANQTGDDYILTTVFFATVLFFTGIATKYRNIRIKSVLVAFACAGLVFAVVTVSGLPFH